MRNMEEDSVDLVFGSPPYEDARTYGIDFKLKGQDWVDWMVEVYRQDPVAPFGPIEDQSGVRHPQSEGE